MINPEKFKAPFIPKEKIWAAADALRKAFPAFSGPPVEVLKLAELGLGLDFELKNLAG